MIPDFHARRFDRAAATYAAHAAVQTEMALDLIRLAPDSASQAGDTPSLLEFGCGTGIFTRILLERFPRAAMLATDASPRMLEAARAAAPGNLRVAWAVCDASGSGKLPPPLEQGRPFDLGASNALVQWFPDLAGHFALAASLLRPGGWYLVSGFAQENFPELNALLREQPFGYRDFPGHDRERIVAAAEAAGLKVEALEQASREVGYPDVAAFFAAIKAMGSARRPQADAPLTRKRLADLERAYQERYGGAEGIRATWMPWFARLRKP